MQLICPECKNEVNLSSYGNLDIGSVLECDTCGINLLVKEVEGEKVETEVVDEGK